MSPLFVALCALSIGPGTPPPGMPGMPPALLPVGGVRPPAKPAPAVAEKPGDKPSDGVPARADPAFLTMEQQLDRVTRELAESNKAAPEIPRPAVAPALRNCARGGEGGSRRSCSTR